MALTKIPSSLLDTSGGFDLQGNITLGDNERIQFGDGTDFEIYSDGGSNNYLISNNGALILRNLGDDKDIYLQSDDGSGGFTSYIHAKGSTGEVILKHYGSNKIATSSTGATVTGTLTVTGDLDITGNVNSYNVTDLDVTDQTITLGAGQTEANSGGSGIIIDGSSASILWDETNDTFDINKGLNVDSDTFVVDNTNNRVGIGTSSPAKTLHLAAGSSVIRLEDTDGGYGEVSGSNGNIRLRADEGNTQASSFMSFDIDSTEEMRLTSTGLGIGTTSPAVTLDVTGNGRFDSVSGNALRLDRVTSGNNIDIDFHNPIGTAGVIAKIRVDGDGLSNLYGALSFHTGTTPDSPSEAMRIDRLGNVGIGTNDPSQKMEISGNLRLGGMILKNTSDGGSIGFNRNPDDGTYIGNSGLRRFQLNGPGATSGDYWEFQSYNSSGTSQGNIRIQDGNLGIGTTPSEHLHVNSGTSTTVAKFQSALGGAGNVATVKVTASGNSSDGLRFIQCGSTSLVEGGANAATIENTENAPLLLGTNGTERMRIDSSGNLLVGTTSNPSTGTGGSSFTVESAGRRNLRLSTTTSGAADVANFYNSNGQVGRILLDGSSCSFQNLSDYRLKENVDYEFNALDRVAQLKPARFNFIADADTTVDGFLAHEVQDIVPEAISGEKDAVKEEEYEVTPAVLDDDGNVITEAEIGTREVPEYQYMDVAKLVPLLTKAIQELKTELDAAKARITELEG